MSQTGIPAENGSWRRFEWESEKERDRERGREGGWRERKRIDEERQRGIQEQWKRRKFFPLATF